MKLLVICCFIVCCVLFFLSPSFRCPSLNRCVNLYHSAYENCPLGANANREFCLNATFATCAAYESCTSCINSPAILAYINGTAINSSCIWCASQARCQPPTQYCRNQALINVSTTCSNYDVECDGFSDCFSCVNAATLPYTNDTKPCSWSTLYSRCFNAFYTSDSQAPIYPSSSSLNGDATSLCRGTLCSASPAQSCGGCAAAHRFSGASCGYCRSTGTCMFGNPLQSLSPQLAPLATSALCPTWSSTPVLDLYGEPLNGSAAVSYDPNGLDNWVFSQVY